MLKMKKAILFILIVALISGIASFDVCAEEAGVYHKCDNGERRIALTFDDGPHPRLTPMILDILCEYNISATFFVIGKNVIDYPDTMKKLADSGCEIANHTFSHKDLVYKGNEEIKDELLRCADAINNGYGITPRLVRPPHGMYDDDLIDVSEKLGYDIILWSIDTKDWAHEKGNDIAKRVLSSVEGGDIILMHDFIGRDSHTCEALRIIIPELLERGYKFVTVSELIGKA